MTVCPWPLEPAIKARFSDVGGDQGLHGVRGFLGRCEVLEIVAQHLHTPVRRGLVDGRHHLDIDDVVLFEGLVRLQPAVRPFTLRSNVCASDVTATM